MATCPSGHESADDDFCDVCGFAIGPVGVREPASAAARSAAVPSAAVPLGAASAVAAQCPRCGIPRAGQFCEACGYDFTASTAGAAAPPPVTKIDLSAAPPAPPRPATPDPASVTPTPVTPTPVTPAPVTPAPDSPSSAAQPTVPPAAAMTGGADWTAVVTADRAYYDSVQATGGPGAGGIGFPVYCPQRRFRLAGPEVRIGRRSAHSGIDPEIDLTGPPADPGVSRLHAVLLKAADGSWSVVDPGSANGTLVNGTEISHDELVPLRDGDRIHLGAWTELRISREG